MRRKNSSMGKRVLLVALFVAVLGGISFGYAQLKETLTINGNAKIKSVQWNVNLQNLNLVSNSVVDSDNTVQIKTGNVVKEEVVYSTSNSNLIANVEKHVTTGGIELDFDVTLKEPGKQFSFTFDVANDGTLDAKLKSIEEDGEQVDNVSASYTKTVENGTEPYFRYTITGAPAKNSILAKNTKKTVTVLVEYPELNDAQNLPTADYEFHKTIKFNYEQN